MKSHRSPEIMLSTIFSKKSNKMIECKEVTHHLLNLPKISLAQIASYLDTKSQINAKKTCLSFYKAIEKCNSIVISYENLRNAIINGIQKYQSNGCVMGDRDGLYNGAKGQCRSQLALQYVNGISVHDHPGLIALLFAIFRPKSKSFFGYSFGRSSRLAGLIADGMIQGNYSICYGNLNDTISSSVFSEIAVKAAKHDWDNHHVSGNQAGASSYFDTTLGVRKLLKNILLEFNHEEQDAIKNAYKKLILVLENSSVDAKPDFSFMPSREMRTSDTLEWLQNR